MVMRIQTCIRHATTLRIYPIFFSIPWLCILFRWTTYWIGVSPVPILGTNQARSTQKTRGTLKIQRRQLKLNKVLFPSTLYNNHIKINDYKTTPIPSYRHLLLLKYSPFWLILDPFPFPNCTFPANVKDSYENLKPVKYMQGTKFARNSYKEV